MAGAGNLRQSPNVGLQGCASRSLGGLCNEPANQRKPEQGRLLPSTDAFPPTQVSARKRKEKICFQLLQPASPILHEGGGGCRGGQPQGQTQGPVGLIKSSPTSLLVKVLCACR